MALPSRSALGPSAAYISEREFCIGGILTTVYGLEELGPDIKQLSCLWLLHPRLETQACMQPLAAYMVNSWNKKSLDPKSLGFIAISFDHRNHGSRLVSARANETWRTGNPTHAQDMFSIYHGTFRDTSTLIDQVSIYLFPRAERTIVDHMVLGVSLGGHTAWQCLLHEDLITACVIVVGCPNFGALMLDRAGKSKPSTFWPSSFFGSPDFPASLIRVVRDWDPAAVYPGLLQPLSPPSSLATAGVSFSPPPQQAVIPLEFPSPRPGRASPLMRRLRGKHVLNLAGDADKLVPYSCCQPFLTALEATAAADVVPLGSPASVAPLVVQNIVHEGVGHEMTVQMVRDAWCFIEARLREKDHLVARWDMFTDQYGLTRTED
ncbi:MAG: hypothetical protein M1826_003696 [Phylliscum demangeonii]|nr:MAG: hypothetical protein M1826_003696 [Phylliscum demangeonii]